MSPSTDPQFCHVTTRGRITGNPHEIEIWFAREPDATTIYASPRIEASWA